METLTIKVTKDKKAFLLELLSQFPFVETQPENSAKPMHLPVAWAEKADVTALFSVSKSDPIRLATIRKTWKRNH